MKNHATSGLWVHMACLIQHLALDSFSLACWNVCGESTPPSALSICWQPHLPESSMSNFQKQSLCTSTVHAKGLVQSELKHPVVLYCWTRVALTEWQPAGDHFNLEG